MTSFAPLQPYDEHNQKLEAHVHPLDWTNPTPSGRYNLVVIGGGTAGLVSAMLAAGLGAKVALVERSLLGGDCLNVGCVPSKAIIASARRASAIRTAHELGIFPAGSASSVSEVHVDFASVMRRMRRLRSEISLHDSARRLQDAGVDVFLGEATFLDRNAMRVDDRKLNFSKAIIATGGRPASLPVDGVDSTEVLTNETIFSLTELPPRLVVIGGGPIGSEMAQTFAQLGSQVTLIERSPQILAREEPDAAKIVMEAMRADGVDVLCQSDVVSLQSGETEKRVCVKVGHQQRTIACDQILTAVGRVPNVEAMGLENAGVEFDSRRGVSVNDYLQTTNRNIYAAGDVAGMHQFTHAADFMARTVVRNALFKGRSKISKLVIPWATYTSPELARVGLNSAQAMEQDVDIDAYTVPLKEVDRAIVEGETDGLVRAFTRKGSDRLVGATVVARNAGDLIGELTLAIRNGVGLKGIGESIHPYPTQAEAIRKLGDLFNRTRLTPTVARLMKTWLRWTR